MSMSNIAFIIPRESWNYTLFSFRNSSVDFDHFEEYKSSFKIFSTEAAGREMSTIYDNWDRLVGAVIRREQLWQMFHDQSPSVSSASSDFSLDSPLHDFPRGSSSYHQGIENFQIKEQSVTKKLPQLVFFDGFNPAFDFDDILKSPAEFLGKGTFGSTYSAVIESGITIVVKRLKEVNIPEKMFRQQMEVIGNVRHENVSPLRAYYFSEDEKLVLYDYYSNGSISAMLHGKPGENRAQLDWDTRVRIAVGAARGIAYIHTQKGGKLVHGNIKSSYIFLNSEQYGCVSDLGLANMIATSVKQTEQYHAPEVKNTRNVSQASDVYSFGILLLELLTRKSPLHSTGGDEVVDLVKLVNSVNRKKHTTKVFDVELLRNPDIEEQMVKMLQIGMSCVAKTQKKRPKMSEVVKMMEDIRMMSTRICSLRKKLVFTEGFNPAFDLRDMLRASAEVLGNGMFGNSYKAKLENGITIMVKRLKGVNVTSQAFPQQMEVIGRMRHENVAALMAYYCLNDEILMVYDYYGQGSVFSILHGKRGQNQISLDWETRLRIAVGAARGIAHIHTQLGQKLIHGNVKASNIFLNAQQYGCVSDGGLITLMGQTALPATRSAGYHAPEVADNKKFSQASDVYSFGIVLLELLTGKVPTHSADDGNVNQLRRWVISVISNDWTLEVFDEELQGVPNTEAAMVQSLKVAMSCVESVPKNRPKMSEVVKMLEDISEIKMGANSPLKQD